MKFLDDIAVLLRSKKTSFVGIVSMIVGILTLTGVITVEQREAVEVGADTLIDSGAFTIEQISGFIEIILGLGLIFAKDGDKSTEDVTPK